MARTRSEEAAYIEGYRNGGRRMIGNVRIAYGLMPDEGTPEMKRAEDEFQATLEGILMIHWTPEALEAELQRVRRRRMDRD